MSGPSLYTAMPVAATSGAAVLAMAWRKCKERPLLAASVKGRGVMLLDESGDLFEETVIRATQGDADALVLDWSPMTTAKGNLLAIGWTDGTVMIWSLPDHVSREDAEHHAPFAVSLVRWAPDSERLISADARPTGATDKDSAALAVWKVDDKGRPTNICTYRRPAVGGFTHAIYRTSGRVKKMITSAFAAAECPPFYCGGNLGVICWGNDMGKCTDAISGLGAPLAEMLYDADTDQLFVITKLNMLAQYKLVDNKPTQVSKVKLSMGKEGLQSAVWAAPAQLALTSADHVIRVTDHISDNNYALALADVPPEGSLNGHKLVCLAQEAGRGTLAAATRECAVVVYSHAAVAADSPDPEAAWRPSAPVTLPSSPLQLSWAPANAVLAARMSAGLCLLPETVLRRAMDGEWAVLQLAADTLKLEHVTGASFVIDAKMRICGCAMHAGHLAIWSGTHIHVYAYDENSERRVDPSRLASFETRTRAAAIWKDSLYLCIADRIEVTNFQGTVKSSMALLDSEGAPSCLAVAGNAAGAFCVVGTDRGFVKAWDISRREARVQSQGKRLAPAAAGCRIITVSIAADGSRISATVDMQTAEPAKTSTVGLRAKSNAPLPWVRSSALHVYVVDADVEQTHDFGSRLPSGHYWDATETKLLAVETRPDARQRKSEGAELEVVTMFSTADGGLRVRDVISAESELETLISVQVPKFYFARCASAANLPSSDASAERDKDRRSDTDSLPNSPQKRTSSSSSSATSRLASVVMREFEGMKEVDDATRHALVEFSYYLTIGSMDEAHRAVKLIKHASVWENMAKMCVKTKRLDVAEVCLGNMGHARGARAVRETAARCRAEEAEAVGENGDHAESGGGGGGDVLADACAAMVAIQLGLLDEAEKLYEGCGRYDLLNELLQATGAWERALEVAEAHDRIHLRTTHYAYARQLESAGDLDGALEHYIASGTHKSEVPRMLFDAGQIGKLREYIDGAQEPELFKWWGQYCESSGQFDNALEYYNKAKDKLATVRVLCFHDDLERAAEIVNESEDDAAAFHLARQFEMKERIKEAVFYYQRAHRFNHAVRLAKENNMSSELTMLALQAPPRLMLEAASYFEECNMPEKAVTLYQKSGNTAKALDLCFRCRLFDALRDISDSLSAESDPQLLQRCAEFFLDHGQYEKTVHLFAAAGDASRALDLCVLHNIAITEDLGEKMCPPLGGRGAETAEARNATLQKIAKCCKRQANYHLACKKYTQAGERVKAMKCLLKSGDSDKIIYYAGVSRDRDIYVMAANYLQKLDWHSDANILKHITTFYTKAKAFEQLSSFYDACAQVEIDEYRDYEKAVGALREALNVLNKARVQGKESKVMALQTKVSHVEAFVGARKMVKSDPEQMIALCHELLSQRNVEAAIRVGDVYALMIEWHYSQGQMEAAYTLVERMRERNIILAPYLDSDMVAAICNALGVPVAADAANGADDDDAPEEAIEEDVDDD